MKVIDLLSINKKEMPKCVKHYSGFYVWDKEEGDFFKGCGDGLLQWCVSTFNIQNHFIDEVEVIEEDKKIEHLDIYNCFEVMGIDKTGRLDENFTDISNKINEIIDKINKGE